MMVEACLTTKIPKVMQDSSSKSWTDEHKSAHK